MSQSIRVSAPLKTLHVCSEWSASMKLFRVVPHQKSNHVDSLADTKQDTLGKILHPLVSSNFRESGVPSLMLENSHCPRDRILSGVWLCEQLLLPLTYATDQRLNSS